MRINQTFAEQATQSTMRTSRGMVRPFKANETTIHQETQIGIMIV
jgi:hypothetical protein